MRRGWFILTLTLMLVGGAATLGGPKASLQTLRALPPAVAAGIALLVCAAACGLIGMVSLRSACRRLAGHLRQPASEAAPLPLLHPDLRALTDAVAAKIDHSGQLAAKAELRAKEMEIQLKVATAERQYLEAVIHGISDAVLVTDPYNEIVLANDSAARTFEFDLGGAGRSPVARALRDPTMIGLIQEMSRSDSPGARRIVEHRIAASQGERIFKVTLANIRTPTAQAGGVVAVLHDVTREKEVAQLKNDFVSSVSHELRTPLASIKAYAEMLIDGEAGDEKTAHEFYEVIHNEANRLGRLIDNILSISRIESGLVKINKRAHSLTVLVREAVEVILPQAKQKRITVEEHGVPALYQTLVDRDMIYESVLNLLSNAVKYTPEEGKVVVQTAVDESRRVISVRISDTGVGIPQKDLPYIFDKFFRSETNNRMAKGTGLGLSLVRHIIENVHQGRLTVESQVGKGSTFGFELGLVE